MLETNPVGYRELANLVQSLAALLVGIGFYCSKKPETIIFFYIISETLQRLFEFGTLLKSGIVPRNLYVIPVLSRYTFCYETKNVGC